MEKKRVGIIGAAGLSAGKLIEIISRHPDVELHTAISDSSPGAPISSSHPHLRGIVDRKFDAFSAERLGECDVVFSCKKAGETFPFIEELLSHDVRFIDLSGDYRLKNPEHFTKWYGLPHKYPNLLDDAIYGLPEWYRPEIKQARLLSNPGCYTTTSILACAPFLEKGIGVSSTIVVDAISGVSGAGRAAKAENLYISVAANVRAYRVGNHQHTPEIEQELSKAAARGGHNSDVQVLFVPHVGPYKIGIMADCYLRVPDGQPFPSTEQAHHILQEKYGAEPFVRVYEPGVLPQIDFVANTNFCDIGVVCDARTRTVAVFSVTDNLVKGAAGQAVQNMNIMLGFDERAGLL